jgi:hypothetical protein
MTALRVDGFFTTQMTSIIHGRWDTTKQYNPVFLSLMLLSRGGERSPSRRRSPQIWIDSLSRARTTDSTVSTFRSDGMSVAENLGQRETLSFTLVHNLLTYLCTVEHRARPNSPLWINWYTLIQSSSLKRCRPDSDRFPVVAGGQTFGCENDGSIYLWHRKPSGMRKKNRVPLCSIQA